LRLTTTAVNCADYAHGWYKAIRPGCLGIVLAPEYDEASVEARMVRSITGRGGRVLLVTSSEGPRDEAVAVVRHPAVREWLAPLAQIVPCQTLMGWMMGAGPGGWGCNPPATVETLRQDVRPASVSSSPGWGRRGEGPWASASN
jgi:hypothetical protein